MALLSLYSWSIYSTLQVPVNAFQTSLARLAFGNRLCLGFAFVGVDRLCRAQPTVCLRIHRQRPRHRGHGRSLFRATHAVARVPGPSLHAASLGVDASLLPSLLRAVFGVYLGLGAPRSAPDRRLHLRPLGLAPLCRTFLAAQAKAADPGHAVCGSLCGRRLAMGARDVVLVSRVCGIFGIGALHTIGVAEMVTLEKKSSLIKTIKGSRFLLSMGAVKCLLFLCVSTVQW